METELERQHADLDNLAEEFLDEDPQQGAEIPAENKSLEDYVDKRSSDSPDLVNFPPQYEDDVVLSNRNDDPGPLDTEYLPPAPSQVLNADEESGGMYGSTADELIGSDGPDEQDLGASEQDYGKIQRTFAGNTSETVGDEIPFSNVDTSEGMEDRLSTDLPVGGTYGDLSEPIVDPATGELTDYDDTKQERAKA
jgi:hypothetical protein